MAEYKKQTIIASTIAIVIALSVGLGIYFTQPNLNPSTSETTSSIPIIFNNHPAILIGAQTTNSTTGLGLSVLLNASSYYPGQGVSINITEYNTLSTANNVSRERNWPLSGMSLGGCGTLNYPFGISIFHGYYGASNISQLANQSSLSFYPSGVYSCPMMFAVNNYNFSPSSDNATLGVAPNGTAPIAMTSDVSTKGSWTPSSNGSIGASTYHEFIPGAYTVVGGDEWGDLVIVHFDVIASAASGETVTGATSSSSNSA